MTGIELNGRLAAIWEDSNREPEQKRRTGRQYRRWKELEKSNRLLAIVQLPGYAPHRGYVDRGSMDKTLLHTGKYIKYPKNSNCQRWIKRAASKKVRTYPSLPQKGNGYRRVFDYWWTLY